MCDDSHRWRDLHDEVVAERDNAIEGLVRMSQAYEYALGRIEFLTTEINRLRDEVGDEDGEDERRSG